MSSNAQKSAASTAANATTTAADQANTTQMAMFQQEQSDMAPYQAMGINAGNALSNLMGLGSVQSGTGAGGQVTAADVRKMNAQNNPNSSSTTTSSSKSSSGKSGGMDLANPSYSITNSVTGGNSTANAILDPGGSILNAIGLAKGGPTEPKPVMVGERGPEVLINKYGKHIVGKNGPEIIHPTVPGFVQPNPHTAATNKEARANFLKAAKMSPIHRAMGGPVSALPDGNFHAMGTGYNPGMGNGIRAHAQGNISPTSFSPNHSGLASKFGNLMQEGDMRMSHPASFGTPSSLQYGTALPAVGVSPSSTVPSPTTRAINPTTAGPATTSNPYVPPGSNIGTGISGNPATGTASQSSADTLLGQGLGAGYNASEADSTSAQVLSQSPQYQFAMQQGIEGLDASAAASGGLLSGGHLAAILNYSQGLASQQYNNVYSQLMGMTSMGEAAAAGQATNAAVTGAGISQNYMSLGNTLAQGAYYQGNTTANMWNSIANGMGSAYGMYMGGKP